MRKLGYHDHEAKPYLVSRTWHWTKIILRLITKVLSSIIIAIEIPTAVKYKEQQADLPQAEQQSSMVGIAITVGPLLLMTTWDTLELLTLCVRRRRRGIHPMFHIAAELFFWPLMAFLTVLISLIAFRASGTKGVGYADLQMFEAFAFGTKVVAVLFALMTLIRFIIFVRACVETNDRRKVKRMGTGLDQFELASHHGQDRSRSMRHFNF